MTELPGGAEGLNNLVVEQLRERFVVPQALSLLSAYRDSHGELFPDEDAWNAAWKVARLIGTHLDQSANALPLLIEVASSCEGALGANARHTWMARYKIGAALVLKIGLVHEGASCGLT